jgi:hypothetical protein
MSKIIPKLEIGHSMDGLFFWNNSYQEGPHHRLSSGRQVSLSHFCPLLQANHPFEKKKKKTFYFSIALLG